MFVHASVIYPLPSLTRSHHPNPNPNIRDYFNITFDKKDTTNMFRWTASHRFFIESTSTTIDNVSFISHEIQRLREKIILKYGMDMLSIS